MTSVRVYGVADATTTRLVVAANQAQALRYVAQGVFRVEALSALETAELMEKGVRLEHATPESDSESQADAPD